MQIKKAIIWWNPTTLKSVNGPRWDAEVQYSDGSSERFHDVSPDTVISLHDNLIKLRNENLAKPVKCRTCAGAGVLYSGVGKDIKQISCDKCDGKGMIVRLPVNSSKGKGDSESPQ